MATSAKTKKKHLKRLRDASARSQTAYRNDLDRRDALVQEVSEFLGVSDIPEPTPTEIIKLDDVGGGDLRVICSCGWYFGPDTALALGRVALEHAKQTGHVLRGGS